MNYKSEEILVFCPVYNEAHHLKDLIDEIKSTKFLEIFYLLTVVLLTIVKN